MENRIKEQGYFLIAEIGVNYYDIAKKHNISLMEAAKLMCKKAKEANIDAVKFQSYKAEKLASKNSPAYWDTTEETTKSQYELFKKFDIFGEKEYNELSKYCKKIEIDFFSTPFDFESADYLDKMMNYYKISSSDLNNLPFVKYIAKKNKPILLSTGASTKEEIENTVKIIRSYNQNQLVLMHCILEYPTIPAHASLNKIVSLKKQYPDVIIGYSDHTKPDNGYVILQTAYNLGATVIEKHFTLDKSLLGNDHYHAMDVEDAKQIKERLNYINMIRGNYELGFEESETISRKYARRSLVTCRTIKKGEIIKEQDFTYKRPGVGISPEFAEKVIGTVAIQNMNEDHILTWKDIQ